MSCFYPLGESAMRPNKTIGEPGLTIIEILFFVVNCAIGVIVAKIAGARFGTVGYVLGFLGGWAAIPIVASLLLRRKPPSQ